MRAQTVETCPRCGRPTVKIDHHKRCYAVAGIEVFPTQVNIHWTCGHATRFTGEEAAQFLGLLGEDLTARRPCDIDN